jgi:hypothetical protein
MTEIAEIDESVDFAIPRLRRCAKLKPKRRMKNTGPQTKEQERSGLRCDDRRCGFGPLRGAIVRQRPRQKKVLGVLFVRLKSEA